MKWTACEGSTSLEICAVFSVEEESRQRDDSEVRIQFQRVWILLTSVTLRTEFAEIFFSPDFRDRIEASRINLMADC